MNYDIFTQKDIDNYFSNFPKQKENPDLVSMINWFSDGAISAINNFLFQKISEEGENKRKLIFGIAEHCLCGSCYEWQIVEEMPDGEEKVITSTESLKDWLREKK